MHLFRDGSFILFCTVPSWLSYLIKTVLFRIRLLLKTILSQPRYFIKTVLSRLRYLVNFAPYCSFLLVQDFFICIIMTKFLLLTIFNHKILQIMQFHCTKFATHSILSVQSKLTNTLAECSSRDS